jgi:uncharacterized membrane protein YeaQ/YmgE (transglycosylase-associated protein family)
MQETAQEVLTYLGENPILYAVIAFIAGFAASKTVASEWRFGLFSFLIVGALGLFLGQFSIVFFHLKEILEQVSQFRLLFDFIAAYVGSFFVAAVIHFIKPN